MHPQLSEPQLSEPRLSERKNDGTSIRYVVIFSRHTLDMLTFLLKLVSEKSIFGPYSADKSKNLWFGKDFILFEPYVTILGDKDKAHGNICR